MNVSPWNSMLAEYVDDQGLVNYALWQQESAKELDQWLISVNRTNWQELSREDAIAFLINLYNALTIQQVLQNYPIPSIRPTCWGVPNWLAFLRFFTREVYVLNGRSLSLNAIEHGMLRKKFNEPRIHFALVCASIGCPLLRTTAYCPDHLFNQLEEDAHRFIHNSSKVRYEAASKTLHCSKIFKWYGADFLTQSDSIIDYISQYHINTALADATKVAYLPYSWDLNQRTSA